MACAYTEGDHRGDCPPGLGLALAWAWCSPPEGPEEAELAGQVQASAGSSPDGSSPLRETRCRWGSREHPKAVRLCRQVRWLWPHSWW